MKAANFTLPSTNKKNFTLNESLGKYVVLYFYPKDDTPGCTIEAKDFSQLNSLISIDTRKKYVMEKAFKYKIANKILSEKINK